MYYITRARGSNGKVPHLAVPKDRDVSKEFVLIGKKGVTWKYRTLLCKVWVRSSFSLLSNVPHVACNVWVGCLFSLLRNVPHVARNVWVGSSFSLYIPYIIGTNLKHPLSHTLQATCCTLLFNENELLTHTLQATCGTLLSNENELLTHTLQARCGTFTLPPRLVI